ncbi:MAG: methylmalonyl-CoA epimerase [Candidatus Eremiobacteraeota bacterium]|nr:methylmalonyl-CoA epimerase [Candidatus Eremiobacteraeota bacterium]
MNKLNHIGIAVNDLKKATDVYKTFLKDVEIEYEEVASQKVKVAILPLGESSLEFLEPTQDDSPIAKFLQKRGQGIHHMCIEVDDIEEALKSLEENGYRLIDKKPREGAMGMKVAFIHPKSTDGVLLELSQKVE